MKLDENTIKLMKESALKNLPDNKQLRAKAEANPAFQQLRKNVSDGPLVPPNQVQAFTRGLALLNNPKALNSAFKKGGVYDNKADRRNIVNHLSTGAQLFTKGMGQTLANFTIKAGDEAKAKIKKANKTMNEQGNEKIAKVLKTINKAQKNAAAYLSANVVKPSEMEKYNINPGKSTPAPRPTAAEAIRELIRKKVLKLINN